MLKVESERSYHQKNLQILDQLVGQASEFASISTWRMLFSDEIWFMYLFCFGVSFCRLDMIIFAFHFLTRFILSQMVSERQRIETSPSRMFTDSVPSPPSYEEASGIWSSQTMEGSTDSVGYFLGEVCLFLSLFPGLILFFTWYSCCLSTNVS